MTSMNYMTPGWSIAGYTYNADTYCRECMKEIALCWPGAALVFPAGALDLSTEAVLDEMARYRNLNREDEYSFDSGRFPKVIFESSACPGDADDPDDGHDRCGTPSCGIRLCEQ